MLPQSLRASTLYLIAALVNATNQPLVSSETHLTPSERLASAVRFYGNLQTFECEGTLSRSHRGSPKYHGESDFSSGSYVTTKTDTREFQFSYSRDGRISFRIYNSQNKSKDIPDIEISTNPDNEYEHRHGGELEETTTSINDSLSKSTPLLTFLFDLLDSDRHFRLLTEPTKWWESTHVDGIKCKGAHLNQTTHKWLWIDPETLAVRKIKYIDRAKTRRREAELLMTRLDALESTNVEKGNQLANEIDDLLSRNNPPIRFTVEFSYLSFNQPLVFQ